MKRTYVYDVEQRGPDIVTGHSRKINPIIQKNETWIKEKKTRAVKTIKNAGILSDVVKSFEEIKLNESNVDDERFKDAIKKISSVIEDMRMEFKNDYWE